MNINFQIAPIPTDSIYSKSQFETSGIPIVEWSAPSEGTYYTLLCVDPDALEPDWLHWLAVNCRGANPGTGTTLAAWEPPTPPSGTHKYNFTLYSHSAPVKMEPPVARSNFDTAAFVKANGLTRISQTVIRVKA